MESQPNLVDRYARGNHILGFKPAVLGFVGQLNSRPHAGIMDAGKERQIPLPVAWVIAAQVTCPCAERIVRCYCGSPHSIDLRGTRSVSKGDLHNCPTLLQDHTVILKPCLELASDTDIAYAWRGLSLVSDKSERYMR